MRNNQTIVFVVLGAIGVVGFLLFGIFASHPSTPAPQSGFVLSPTSAPSPTPFTEPIVLQWETYTNDPYQFSIDYPRDWKKQEYYPSGGRGGITVAFSAEELPCSNCSYTTEGYYSVTVYSHTTDPFSYDEYQDKKKKSQDAKTDRQVVIDGKQGILLGTSIFLEQGDWVYEIAFDQMGNSTSIESSKIFIRAVTSFKFTTLTFIK